MLNDLPAARASDSDPRALAESMRSRGSTPHRLPAAAAVLAALTGLLFAAFSSLAVTFTVFGRHDVS